jgi:hypothetical protein
MEDETFRSDLPNRMAYTNPGAISNSGNAYFTNQKSKIYKLNLNISNNANEISNYLNLISSEQINTNTGSNNNYSGNSLINILEQQKKYSESNKSVKPYELKPISFRF